MPYTPEKLEKYVSIFIESEFPSFYEDLGPRFVDFVVCYFQWLESEGKPVYWNRRLPDLRDIDSAPDDFLKYYRDTYLPGVKIDSSSDTRTLVKHSLDVFRAKGTPLADDLFFRLVYGTGAEVYFPGDDLFRLSNSRWVQPKYLELVPGKNLSGFNGKDIVGVFSGSRAFVERVIRYSTGTKIEDVLAISALEGDFRTGEPVNLVAEPLPVHDCPRIAGSLSYLDVIDSGSDFAVGDRVTLTGHKGVRGGARVTEVEDATGRVTFTVEDGGYGFTANAQILVSSKVLALTNAVADPAWTGPRDLSFLETLTQPMAHVNYVGANNSFANNDSLTFYAANGTAVGTAVVLSDPSVTNSTAGTLFVAPLTGNSALGTNFYKAGNSVHANVSVINGYSDSSASGRVMGLSTNVVLTYAVSTDSVLAGETLLQSGANGVAQSPVFSNGAGQVVASRTVGKWRLGPMTGSTSGTVANVTAVELTMGVDGVSGQFRNDSRVPLVTSVSNTQFSLSRIGAGTGATFSVGGLADTETVSYNTDYLYDYRNTFLGATAYGFPAAPAANAASFLADVLSFTTVQVGRITSLTNINPGTGYSAPPLARAWEPFSWVLRERKVEIDISGATGAFVAGELIDQATSNARGRVLTSNSSHLLVEWESLFKEFREGFLITGRNSGSVANVDHLAPRTEADPLDLDGEYVGSDDVIFTRAGTAPGSLSRLEVTDSGLYYEEGEIVTVSKLDSPTVATAKVHLGKQGVGEGYWTDLESRLSSVKHVIDSDYWQDFSYDIRSSVMLRVYEQALKTILHVAGTKSFASYAHKVSQLQPISASSALRISIDTTNQPLTFEVVGTGISTTASSLGSPTVTKALPSSPATISAGNPQGGQGPRPSGASVTGSAGTTTEVRSGAIPGAASLPGAGDLIPAVTKAAPGTSVSASPGVTKVTAGGQPSGAPGTAAAADLSDTVTRGLTGAPDVAGAGSLSVTVPENLASAGGSSSAGDVNKNVKPPVAGAPDTASAGTLFNVNPTNATGAADTASAGSPVPQDTRATTGAGAAASPGSAVANDSPNFSGALVTDSAGALKDSVAKPVTGTGAAGSAGSPVELVGPKPPGAGATTGAGSASGRVNVTASLGSGVATSGGAPQISIGPKPIGVSASTGSGTTTRTIVKPATGTGVTLSAATLVGGVPVNTVAPAVTPTAPGEGDILTSTTGTWTGTATITYAYQWYTALTDVSGNVLTDSVGRPLGVAINGATASTYSIPVGYAGQRIFCTVTATNGLGTNTADSNVTSAVQARIIAPGAGVTASAGTVSIGGQYTGPGDVATGWAAWAGLRAFSFASIGQNVVELRENGTNTTQIFTSQTDGSLNWSAIDTFRTSHGGTKVFVRTLYEQASGSSVNLVNTTNATQPELDLTERAMKFTTAATEFLASVGNITLTSLPCSISAVAKQPTNSTNGAYMFDYNSALGQTNSFLASWDGSQRVLTLSGGSPDFTISPNPGYGIYAAYAALHNGASSKLSVDGSVTTGTAGTRLVSAARWEIGGNFQIDSSNMFLKETGAMTGDKSANFSALSTNQHTFWGF